MRGATKNIHEQIVALGRNLGRQPSRLQLEGIGHETGLYGIAGAEVRLTGGGRLPDRRPLPGPCDFAISVVWVCADLAACEKLKRYDFR